MCPFVCQLSFICGAEVLRGNLYNHICAVLFYAYSAYDICIFSVIQLNQYTAGPGNGVRDVTRLAVLIISNSYYVIILSIGIYAISRF